MDFVEPVLIDLLTGSIYGIQEYESNVFTVEFPNMPLMDYPLCITEKVIVGL